MTPSRVPRSRQRPARKRRVPKLVFTERRNIGWHVSFRDPKSGKPTRHRFGMVSEEDARVAYYQWLARHMAGEAADAPKAIVKGQGATRLAEESGAQGTTPPPLPPRASDVQISQHSLAAVASGYLDAEQARSREPGQPRSPGTISLLVFEDRRNHVRQFLAFLNRRYGKGAVARMTLAELAMQDVEDYNREIVAAGYSSSQVTKRLQTLKALIDRAGRPEFGLQTLTWNWDSRDVVHGKPGKQRALPSLKLLKKILEHCDLRERTMVWMAIGLGFGQSDLAVIRVGQIDEDSYDLRRGKTGIDRYGSTPPIVWAHIQAYLAESPRPEGQLMFVTHQGRPLVHGKCDSVRQWWRKLRESLGETSETMPGFYVLRHLGATEFGARPGCSISDMKRWLGHSASSRIADVYMRPVPPEHRKLVEWVRGQLSSRSLD